MIIELHNRQQATQAMREVWPDIVDQLQANKKLVVEIREWTKSREQEKHYHAIINRIARQANHLGSKWSTKDWKRFLVDQFSREHPREDETSRIVPSLDGSGIVQLGEQTSEFGIARASEFITWLEAWATEKGIDIA